MGLGNLGLCEIRDGVYDVYSFFKYFVLVDFSSRKTKAHTYRKKRVQNKKSDKIETWLCL